MIAIEQVRRDPDTVRRAMKSRGEPDPVDQILELDASWRRDRTEADEIRNRRNQVNREIGHARSSGQPPAPEVIEEMRTLGRRVDELEASAQQAEEQVRDMLLNIPNLPLAEVPVGTDSEDNRIYRTEGEPAELGFEGLPHWDLAERLGIIDFQRGAKLSGSRFYTTIGAGARLERALISWMLDLHTTRHGYTELALPAVVRRDVMEGSGNLPQVCRQPLPRRGGRPLVDPHRRGSHHQPVPRRDPSAGPAPALLRRPDPLFSPRTGLPRAATPGASSGFTSSTRLRCISSSSPRRQRSRSSGCWATPRRSAVCWAFPGAFWNSAPAIWASPPPGPTT